MTSPRAPDLSLVIPCFDEAEVIAATATDLLDAFRSAGIDLELVLVDNGSSDGTGEAIDRLMAADPGVRKVRREENVGYGDGILAGLAIAEGRLLGFQTAGGEVAPRDVVKVYGLAADSPGPVVAKARRTVRSVSAWRRWVSIVYNVSTNLLFGGLRALDLNGTPKILRRETVAAMGLRSRDWFLDLEVMVKARRLNLPVYELNLVASKRRAGRSHVALATCWEFVINLVSARFGAGRERLRLPDVAARAGLARSDPSSSQSR